MLTALAICVACVRGLQLPWFVVAAIVVDILLNLPGAVGFWVDLL